MSRTSNKIASSTNSLSDTCLSTFVTNLHKWQTYVRQINRSTAPVCLYTRTSNANRFEINCKHVVIADLMVKIVHFTVYPKEYAHGFCFVVVIHWLIFQYPSGLLHWHCGNLTIAPVPAKQPWWMWINTSCEFIMNDCIATTKQSTTKPCAYSWDILYTPYGQPIDRWQTSPTNCNQPATGSQSPSMSRKPRPYISQRCGNW